MVMYEEMTSDMELEEFLRELVEKLNRKFTLQDTRLEEIENEAAGMSMKIIEFSDEIRKLKEDVEKLREGHNKINRNILSIID